MKSKTIYTCDFCSKSFDDEYDCAYHEEKCEKKRAEDNWGDSVIHTVIEGQYCIQAESVEHFENSIAHSHLKDCTINGDYKNFSYPNILYLRTRKEEEVWEIWTPEILDVMELTEFNSKLFKIMDIMKQSTYETLGIKCKA